MSPTFPSAQTLQQALEDMQEEALHRVIGGEPLVSFCAWFVAQLPPAALALAAMAIRDDHGDARAAALLEPLFIDPLGLDACRRRVGMLADRGEYAQAWTLFHEAQRLSPDDAQLLQLEMLTLLSEGRDQEARARAPMLAAQARKLGYSDLAQVLVDLGQHGLAAAATSARIGAVHARRCGGGRGNAARGPCACPAIGGAEHAYDYRGTMRPVWVRTGALAWSCQATGWRH